MVLRDLSTPDEHSSKTSERNLRALPIAPVSDRFVAAVLDFLIFSPIVSFCVATYLRDLKTVLIINSDSDDAGIIWIFFAMCIVALSSIFQAIFLYFWQATPGQKFMQLSVVSFPQWMNRDEELTFAQCLLRPIGWWGSLLMGGIPFLDIVGHPLRRAIHERMSDTAVISLKQQPVDRPLAVETKYISSTLWLFYGVVFAIGLTMMAKTYKAALMQGMMGGQAVATATCSEISADKYRGNTRLDIAVSLYLAKEVDNECVFNEAQKMIWTAQGETKALAELGMALVSEDAKDIEKYHEKTCSTSAKSEACAISKY
ncbi:MAG: RDD family protein, partial [Proteobacteria bacterium]